MRRKMCNQRGNATYNQASGQRELLYPTHPGLHFYLHILFFFDNNVPVDVDLI